MTQIGDTVRIAGVDYIIRFDGRQSLIPDGPHNSSLSEACAESARRLQSAIREKVDTRRYLMWAQTYAHAKAAMGKARG